MTHGRQPQMGIQVLESLVLDPQGQRKAGELILSCVREKKEVDHNCKVSVREIINTKTLIPHPKSLGTERTNTKDDSIACQIGEDNQDVINRHNISLIVDGDSQVVP